MMGDLDFLIEGRAPAVELMNTAADAEKLRGQIHLSTSGFARTHPFIYPEADDYPATLRTQVQYVLMTDGAVAEMTLLAPTWLDYTVSHFQATATTTADEIASRYVAAWHAGDVEALADLYAPTAILDDGMLGVTVDGPDAIATLATESGPIILQTSGQVLPTAVFDLAPDGARGEPAVFFHLPADEPQRADRVALLVRSESECPGSSIVLLELDTDGQVTTERRLRPAADVLRCRTTTELPTGWWTGLTLPLPFAERTTGTIEIDAGPVEIRNGTPATEALVRWAIKRFTAGGLASPAIESVTFDPLDQRCESVPGYADWSAGTTAVLICRDPVDVSTVPTDHDAGADGALLGAPLLGLGHLMLHEFGHAWMRENLDPATRSAFTTHVGQESWNDRSEPWRERAIEWAAETLAWGLRGTPGQAVKIGSPSCAVLVDGYRILTGADPLTSCPDPG